MTLFFLMLLWMTIHFESVQISPSMFQFLRSEHPVFKSVYLQKWRADDEQVETIQIWTFSFLFSRDFCSQTEDYNLKIYRKKIPQSKEKKFLKTWVWAIKQVSHCAAPFIFQKGQTFCCIYGRHFQGLQMPASSVCSLVLSLIQGRSFRGYECWFLWRKWDRDGTLCLLHWGVSAF